MCLFHSSEGLDRTYVEKTDLHQEKEHLPDCLWAGTLVCPLSSELKWYINFCWVLSLLLFGLELYHWLSWFSGAQIQPWITSSVYYSAWAATAKYHRLGGLNNKSIFLTVLEATESKIKVLINVTPSWELSSWFADVV